MKRKNTLWKVISIVFIILFVLILVGGMLRAHFFRSSHTQATEAQTVMARNTALTNMNTNGISVDEFTIKPSTYIRTTENNTRVMDVLIYNSSVRYMYLIDVDSGKIIVYSKIEFYDGLDHSIDQDRRGPGYFRGGPK